MKENNIKAEDTTWEEVKERAALMAEADKVASGNHEQEMENSDTEGGKEQDKNVYEAKFRRAYDFDDGSGMKSYSSIDLSGLADLTTTDGEVFDRILAKQMHAPASKIKDTTYTKFVAMKATGLPVEFFNMLSLRDMMEVTAVVAYYFLYE
ncbi:MAG TPA: hypothetical protein DCZ40_12950 [Lachnospiraceae bacterium]|nr:hypothetical protein [Lachnospiraceae bacterium]